MTTGENIRYHRNQKGLTQKELASSAGIATITLQQYESDKRVPRLKQLLQLSKALDINIDTLLSKHNSPVLKAFERSNNTDSELYQSFKQHLLTQDIEFTETDIMLIENFHALNSKGQTQLLHYLSDLLKIRDYCIQATHDTTTD